MKKHLDLGCGKTPRNPYNREIIFGIDIREINNLESQIPIFQANLSIEPIPFPDNYFDSVSAYDFFEHVPRVALDFSSKTSYFPFIELMNEIYRVLKPDGLLYAVTPGFPNEKSFRDPTHVNIITSKTSRYFTLPHLQAAMYGFQGEFEMVRNIWIHPRDEYHPRKHGIFKFLRNLVERLTGESSHILWEFRAKKAKDYIQNLK
jgi:SAM-dependent methyltransferase